MAGNFLIGSQSVELRAKLEQGKQEFYFDNIENVLKGKRIVGMLNISTNTSTKTPNNEDIFDGECFVSLYRGKNPIIEKVPLKLFQFETFQNLLIAVNNKGAGVEWTKSFVKFNAPVGAGDDGKVVLFQVFYTDVKPKVARPKK